MGRLGGAALLGLLRRRLVVETYLGSGQDAGSAGHYQGEVLPRKRLPQQGLETARVVHGVDDVDMGDTEGARSILDEVLKEGNDEQKAQAQKLINTQTLNGYLAMAERVAAVYPDSVVKTNWDKFLDESAETVSLPAKILLSEDEVNEIRAAQQQRQAELEQIAADTEQANQMKTLSETKTSGGSNVLADVESELRD